MLKAILPKAIIRTVYLYLYQVIRVHQHGIRVWGGLTNNAVKPLQIQQNKLIRICRNKHCIEGSTIYTTKL